MVVKHLSLVTLGSVLFVAAFSLACTQESADDSALASDEAPLKDPTTGAPTCPSPKVLICHIPPGNPANAHDICVGEPAVAHHIANHGDYVGTCKPPSGDAGPPSTDSGPPSTDANPPPPSDYDGGPPIR